MGALQTPHGEVGARHALEMVHEGGVDGRPPERADHGHRLGGDLLRDDDAEAGGDLRGEPYQRRRARIEQGALGGVAGRLGHGLGQRRPHREIAALRERRLAAVASAQREDLHAGQRALRIAQIFTLLPGDLGDGAQHDRGRERQFDRHRREAEGAAQRPGDGGEGLVARLAGADEAAEPAARPLLDPLHGGARRGHVLVRKGGQRDPQGRPHRGLRRTAHRLGDGGRERPADHVERRPRRRREPRREPRALQHVDRPAQSRAIGLRQGGDGGGGDRNRQGLAAQRD